MQDDAESQGLEEEVDLRIGSPPLSQIEIEWQQSAALGGEGRPEALGNDCVDTHTQREGKVKVG